MKGRENRRDEKGDRLKNKCRKDLSINGNLVQSTTLSLEWILEGDSVY